MGNTEAKAPRERIHYEVKMVKENPSVEKSPLLGKWTEPVKRKKMHKGVRVPQRWVLGIMGFFGILNTYTMRICLSLAITEMVVPVNHTDSVRDDTCPSPEFSSPTSSASGIYKWDEYTQGIILSAFYWGYVITHLPGGLLAEKFGGKYSVGLGILFTAIFTLLTPASINWGGSTALIVNRFLMGLGEGITYPAMNVMVAQWSPPEERSKIGSLVFSGAQLGTVFASALSGVILQYSPIGWPAVFYVFGGIGVIWFIVWTIVCYNNPDEHPFISESEKKYLHDRMSTHTHKKPPSVPWRYILTSVPVWALVAAQIGHDWGLFTMVTDLPKYMRSVLKFSITNNGFLSSLPYLVMWFCSMGFSWIADWLITSGTMSRTNVRKLGTSIASIGPGVFIIAASYSGCNKAVVVALFTIGMALMGAFYPGMKVNALDLSPNYTGSLMALVNGLGALTGILTPYVVGVLTPNQTLSEWRLIFWIVLAMLLITNTIFFFCASGDVQEWNDPVFLNGKREEKRQKLENKRREISDREKDHA